MNDELRPGRLLREGGGLPAALVLPNGHELKDFARSWPQVLPRVVVAGDPCFDRIGLLLMPADGLSGYASWPVGAVGPALAVLAVVRPPGESLLLCLLEIGSLGVLMRWSVLIVPPIPVLVPVVLSPVFGTIMGTVIAAIILRYGRLVARSRAEQFAVVTARARRDGVAALRRERALALAFELEPFLQAVACGEIDHDSVAARMRAAELEQFARDELHLPGVLDAGTRVVLATARTRGCVIDLHTDSDSVDVPGVVNALLRTALAGTTPRRLNLSLYPRPDGVLVSLVAVPGDEALGVYLTDEFGHLGISVEVDEEATCVELLA